MWRSSAPLIWLFATLFAQSGVFAWQYPGQYPPGQYPPGQYPPGQYPPGQYPPNTYPTRLPGGVPVGIQVPELKLPKREPKPGAEESKVTLASVDGTLRKMREKDLFLEIGPQQILRFRLLAKTLFRNKQGEPVRDSLLHPGDQLSVQVNPDDEETALRVILQRAASPSERKAAERPFDESGARAPSAQDLGKARTITERKPAAAEAEAGSELPKPAESGPPSTSGEAGATDIARGAGPVTDEAIIQDAREAASRFTAGLPNFLVQQVTSRYFSTGFPARWQPIDVVTADVACVDGKEDYRNVAVNGIPTNAPVERTGTWSTGEFSTTLEDLLSAGTNARFKRRGEDKIAGRPAFIFDYTVAQANSHWVLVAPDQRRYSAPFEGAIWVDKESRRVLRIEQRTTSVPQEFPFSKAEMILDYTFVKIDQKMYLLPGGSENLGCMRGSGTCTRNVIEFRNYRKFTADSAVKFE